MTTAQTREPNAEQQAGKPIRPGQQSAGYKDTLLTPKFWDGIIAWAWFPLLWRNHFRIPPRRWFMAAALSLFSLISAVLWLVQEVLLGRKISRTKVKEAPIFVIGHWRSGTTLLHELLVLDPRHTYPNTFDVFAANHFLVSAWMLRPIFGALMPKQRPMDNMAAGLDRPQEDEFALCNMGVPSPYLTIAFPNHPPVYEEYFDLERISPEEQARWKRGLMWFLQCLTLRNPKRIVLKSPPHTFRIKTLLEMFPEARFVYMVRDPYVLFPSTLHLWKRLYRDEGLQTPTYEGLEEYVFETFNRMHESFERQRHTIPTGQLCEVRYEDLVAQPVEQMRMVYQRLNLDEFEQVRPAIEAYFVGKADYQTNRYQLAPELRAEIARRWGAYAERHGYAKSGDSGPNYPTNQHGLAPGAQTARGG
jgi:hypothetical protein